MKIIEITPRAGAQLYDELVEKEASIREMGRGTFFRSGRTARNKVKWKHKAYPGTVSLARGSAHGVTARLHSQASDREWQMLRAFLGFLDRHLGRKIATISIAYR